jgi:ATP-dependent Lon protease
MATFDDFSFSVDDFSGKGRLFPLPNLVLFPHVMQPLHVFEPRYRDLLKDALAGDRLIVMAVLAPGWEEDYEGRPKLYPMACLARITTHCRLADGTYNALVLGLRRVRLLRELAPARPFREAEIELCEDHYRGCPLTQQWALQQKFRDALMHILPMLPEAQEQLDQLLGNDAPLGILTDVISYLLNIDLAPKQSLLAELDVHRRANLLLTHLSEATAELTASQAEALCFPPPFSTN